MVAGLESEIPALKPARSPPQTELDYDYGT
jgi:hypothetical protein